MRQDQTNFPADLTHTNGENETNYVPYPVQNNVHHLPPDIRDKCLAELEEISRSKPMEAAKFANFADFSRHHFGETLQRVFIRPYNEKVWTVKLEEMNSKWVEGRVPKIDLAQIQKRCAPSSNGLDEEPDVPTFRYPAKCRGIGELWTRFANKFDQRHFMYNTEVLRVDVKEKRMLVRNVESGEESEIRYELMVSTIPLIELNKCCGLFSELKLRHSKVVLVGVGLHKPQNRLASQLNWAYFPRKEISFYRCTVLSNFADSLTPDPEKYWSVLCEIGCRPDEERPEREIIERVIRDLISVRIIDSKEQVYSTFHRVVAYGYPIPTLDRDEQLAECLGTLEDYQIFSRGRFGSWKYEVSNQDHCFEIGRQCVEHLYLDTDERLC